MVYDIDGAQVEFPFDVKEEFGKGPGDIILQDIKSFKHKTREQKFLFSCFV